MFVAETGFKNTANHRDSIDSSQSSDASFVSSSNNEQASNSSSADFKEVRSNNGFPIEQRGTERASTSLEEKNETGKNESHQWALIAVVVNRFSSLSYFFFLIISFFIYLYPLLISYE